MSHVPNEAVAVPEIPSRQIRNDTADVLRRVEAGEDLTITVRGKPVARLTAIEQERRRRWLSRAEFLERLSDAKADPGLRDDLRALAGEMTDAEVLS